MENEYIHIIFDDHELHALWSLGTRYALDANKVLYIVTRLSQLCQQTDLILNVHQIHI